MFPLYSLCALFMDAHPGLLKKSQYDVVVKEDVWELKHAYRETCLCRSCFNYRCYKEVLPIVHAILLLLIENQTAAVDENETGYADESDTHSHDEADGLVIGPVQRAPVVDPSLRSLVEFCRDSQFTQEGIATHLR